MEKYWFVILVIYNATICGAVFLFLYCLVSTVLISIYIFIIAQIFVTPLKCVKLYTSGRRESLRHTLTPHAILPLLAM